MRSSTVQAVPEASRDSTAAAAADAEGDVDDNAGGDVAVGTEEAAALVPTVARAAVTNRPDTAAIVRNRPRRLVRRAVLTRTSL
ncbi:hypothetical protein SVIO_015440 [Streptomyces violaceusniger]|uniref:Uncharacterized protein n=1 Tax=Streptomyces violaceusniger TaxID=68280 RepID=A0A4D4KNQ7_STRVO|nr:hypothetical protein SVIO_015440 [Streptomyces violaceusniger]